MKTLPGQFRELDVYFREIDYCDIKTIEAGTSLRRFIAGMLSYYPWWVVLLFRVRQILVMLLGLVRHQRPEQLPNLSAEEISFTPGEAASFFIVCQAREGSYWVARTPEDKHLLAYFGVVAEGTTEGAKRFTVFTTIHYRHWTGPIYFNLIRPFHHLVVSGMMRSGASN